MSASTSASTTSEASLSSPTDAATRAVAPSLDCRVDEQQASEPALAQTPLSATATATTTTAAVSVTDAGSLITNNSTVVDTASTTNVAVPADAATQDDANDVINNTGVPQLSKNALKKAARRAKREAGRGEWKAAKRAKAKLAKARKREAWATQRQEMRDGGATQEEIDAAWRQFFNQPVMPWTTQRDFSRGGDAGDGGGGDDGGDDDTAAALSSSSSSSSSSNNISMAQRWRDVHARRTQRGVRLCIDMQYDAAMTDKEVKSLLMQLKMLYAFNKRVISAPARLCFASLGATAAPRAHALWSSNAGFENWSVDVDERPLTEIYASEKERIVYLTADSPNVLSALDRRNIYVIGGIVDHNRLTHASLDAATAAGLQTARLPLDWYVFVSYVLLSLPLF
jgi:hypothetical protein